MADDVTFDLSPRTLPGAAATVLESAIPPGGDPFADGAARSLIEADDITPHDLPQPSIRRSEREGLRNGGGAGRIGTVRALPVDHADGIRTDSVTVDVGFYVEQPRHNDGSGAEDVVATRSAPAPRCYSTRAGVPRRFDSAGGS